MLWLSVHQKRVSVLRHAGRRERLVHCERSPFLRSDVGRLHVGNDKVHEVAEDGVFGAARVVVDFGRDGDGGFFQCF